MPSIDDLMAASKRQSIIDTILGGLSNAAERSIVKPARRVFDALTVLGYMQDADGPAALMSRRAQEIQRGVMPSQSDPGLRDAMQKNAIDMGLALQTVYHGSPHKFDKFDMSKVGTGEGAQAYGHGLYFAESPQTAGFYKDVLSTSLPAKVDGGGASVELPQWAASKIQSEGIDSVIAEWSKRAAEARAEMKTSLQPWINEGNAIRMEQELSALQKIKSAGGANVTKPGSLYKVDLPDEHIAKMLDWDKPLSQQAPEVQTMFKDKLASSVDRVADDGSGYVFRARVGNSFGYGKTEKEALSKIVPSDIKGSELYQLLGDQVRASATLKSQGVPGIRYLDQGSRGNGAGTSNFVVFDDKIPKILGRE